jgi:hypothetical protein
MFFHILQVSNLDLHFNFRVEGDFPRVEGRSRKLVDIGFTYKYGLEEILEDSYKCAKELGMLE